MNLLKIDLENLAKFLIEYWPIINYVISLLRNRVKWGKLSKQNRKIASAFYHYSYPYLFAAKPEIKGIGLIDRKEISLIKEYWHNGKNAILLHGESGTGKSVLVLELAKEFANSGIPILFINSDQLPKRINLLEYFIETLDLGFPLLRAFSELSKQKQIVLIVDQFDSIADSEACTILTNFVKTLSSNVKINILIVSRTYEAIHDHDISNLGFKKLELGNLSSEASEGYLKTLGIKKPSENIIKLAGNLLNLSIIAEAPSVAKVSINDLGETKIWTGFIEYISHNERDGEKVIDSAINIARNTTENNQTNFHFKQQDKKIIRKLLSLGIIVKSPGRRYRFRHEKLQYFLCAYSLIPEALTITQIVKIFNYEAIRRILPFYYLLFIEEFPEKETSLLMEILSAKDKMQFFTRASILEIVKHKTSPPKEIVNALIEIFEDEAYNDFFFNDLVNHAWIHPLFDEGFFHRVPHPIEVVKGSYRTPAWPAGNYLKKYAKQNKEIIVDLAASIKTDNCRVQVLLIDALIKIDPLNAVKSIHNIDSWLNTPFFTFLPEKIRILAERFIEHGLIDGAITLLGFVTKPALLKERREYFRYYSPLVFRLDHYWVSEYCDKQLVALIALAPLKIIDIFSAHLKTAIDLIKQIEDIDAEESIGFFWRIDIPNRTFDGNDADVIDILVDGFRDAFINVCEQSKDDGQKLLENYLHCEHIIFKRVALHVLRLFGINYPELLDESFRKVEYLNLQAFVNEYQGLMRDQFQNIPKEAQKLVIETVLEGPKSSQYDEERKEYWIQRNLELIRNSLDKESLAILDHLTEKHGKADITERPRITFGSYDREPSPIPASELENKTFDQLKKILIDFVPGDTDQETRRSLGEALQIIVRENPKKYCDFARFLKVKKIKFVYSYFFIHAISEVVKNSGFKLTKSILDLCEYVVRQEKEETLDKYDKYEPGLLEAQLDVASLFENALRTDDPYMDPEMLSIIKRILIKLSRHADPKDEEYGENSFDPFMRSLNCVRGQAMHGLIQYMLYVYRKDKKLNLPSLKEGIFDSEIQEVFEEKFDKDEDPSLAVHSVFGAYIPQLQLLAPDWLESNLEGIFPEDEKNSKYWDSAWDAYIFTSNLFENVFKLLLPQYKKAVLRLSTDKEKTNLGSSPDERLAQHLMLAYLNDLTEFGHENELFDLFFEGAPDEIRAKGIFWLYENLKKEGVKGKDPKWEKIWGLWNKRLKDAEAEEILKNTKEISCYLRWLAHCPVGYKDLIPLIKKSIKYLHDAYDSRQLIEYIGEHCKENPLESIEILKEVVFLEKESSWNLKDEDEEKILGTAIESGDEEAKILAYEVINFRGERGDFRWKGLLENK